MSDLHEPILTPSRRCSNSAALTIAESIYKVATSTLQTSPWDDLPPAQKVAWANAIEILLPVGKSGGAR